MDDQLLSLLDYDGVLTALATTPDGLVIAAAGLSGDDAEIVGAAGSTIMASAGSADQRAGVLEVGSASLHLLRGDEVSLVVLAESSVQHETLRPLMEESLEAVAAVFS